MKRIINDRTMKLLKPFVVGTFLIGMLYVGALVAEDDKLSANAKDAVGEQQDTSETSLATLVDDSKIDSLTLVEESVQQVLALLEKLTGRILIVANNLPKVSVNLNIAHPLTKQEAVASIKSVLNANGIAVTPMGEKYLRVVPVNRAKSSSPELIDVQQLQSHAASQEICSCLFPFNNLTAREAARMVHSFLTPVVSSVVTLDKANALLITDSLSNLQRLGTIFAKIDKVGDVQEKIMFFDVKNVSAKELKQKFEDLQKGALKRYLLGNTSFEADTRTNQLIVVTPMGNEDIIQSFMNRLDVNVGALARSHVFRIQHGSSKELTALVKRLVQQQNRQEKTDLPLEQPGPNAIKNDQVAQFSKQLSIECDERLNAVVVYGTPTDIRQIQQLIEQLDVVLPQVRIEVIIAEVILNKGQASGLESFGYNHKGSVNTLKDVSMPGLSSNGGNNSFKISSLTFRNFALDTVINTAKTNSNVSILSAPTLLTTHARESLIKISETRPYLSSVQTKSDSSTSPTAADISNSTIEKVDAGIELTVKPLIGTQGVVQLEITQKVDNFSQESTTIGANKLSMPHIMRREAKSFVSIQSGDVLILGGLKQREVMDRKKRMFILGDLPLLGDALFSGKVKEEVIKELIIFIRPYVLSDVDSATRDTKRYIDRLDASTKSDINTYLENGKLTQNSSFEPTKRKARRKEQTHVQSQPTHQAVKSNTNRRNASVQSDNRLHAKNKPSTKKSHAEPRVRKSHRTKTSPILHTKRAKFQHGATKHR
jgi:general secretion pathway protein D